MRVHWSALYKLRHHLSLEVVAEILDLDIYNAMSVAAVFKNLDIP